LKIQKRINEESTQDIYILFVGHTEAMEALERMTPMEKAMVHDLQGSEKVSTILRVLTIWAERIEEGSYDILPKG